MEVLRMMAARLGLGEIGAEGSVIESDGNLLTGVLNTTYLWAGIICVAIIIVAGFFYVTSAGDAGKVKRAKDGIVGAVVGLVVIAMAFVITQFITGRL